MRRTTCCRSAFLLGAALLIAACGADPDVAEGDPDAVLEPAAPDDAADAPDDAADDPAGDAADDPEEEPTMDLDDPVLADAADLALADAAARTGSDAALVSAERVTWSDGSLGCPQPDRMYTQALVEGVRVVVTAGGDTLHYHGSLGGDLAVCDDPQEPAGR